MNLIVQLEGLDQLSLKVKYLYEAAETGLRLSASEAADLFVEEAKALVPVDSGNLRDAIHAELFADERERQVYQVAPFYEAGNEYGFDPAYARRIEYGFVGPDRLGRVYHQAAQPYMRPAFDNQKEAAAAILKEGIYSSLDDAMNTSAAKRAA